MPKIAPSVLAADFAHLSRDIKSTEESGASMLHVDIMDGHFVPNISFGPDVVATINKLTDMYLDVHLMLSEPEKYLEAFAKAGADAITVHLEVHPEPEPIAKQIRSLEVQPGISLKPDMPIERLFSSLHSFDFLLIMSVFPGFGGQSFIEESYSRIAQAREFIDREKLTTRIIVDGGVDANNAASVCEAGADILVMGTAFYKSEKRSELVRYVESEIESQAIDKNNRNVKS